MINIVTINYFLSGDKIVNTTINGNETLLDADLIIANPVEFPTAWTDISENTSLRSSILDRVKNIFNSRKNEISTLLNNGKILVVFLTPIKAIKGESRYGSAEDITNYDFLPAGHEFLMQQLIPGVSGVSNSIVLANQNHLFSQYFKAFKEELQYTAYIDIELNDPAHYFLSNRSNKPVGFSLQSGNGLIVFLPALKNVDHQKLIGTLISCTKKYLTKHEETPPPNWVTTFTLKGETEFDLRLTQLSNNIEKLVLEKENLEKEKHSITVFKGLLYEQGLELEHIVIKFFKLLGFKAENRKLNDLEHDVVFESKEGKGIAEIEGKDNDAIHISKLDQLNRAADEDFELTGKYPQGVLIGNHYRLQIPESRKEPFTEKVLIVTKKKNFGLLTTLEIYKAVEKIFENPDDEEYKMSCRQKILKTEGGIIKLV